jgi:hypothetical protein
MWKIVAPFAFKSLLDEHTDPELRYDAGVHHFAFNPCLDEKNNRTAEMDYVFTASGVWLPFPDTAGGLLTVEDMGKIKQGTSMLSRRTSLTRPRAEAKGWG